MGKSGLDISSVGLKWFKNERVATIKKKKPKQKMTSVDEDVEKLEPLSPREHMKGCSWDFPGGPVVKNLTVNAADTGLIPGLGRSHMLQSNSVCLQQLLSPHS